MKLKTILNEWTVCCYDLASYSFWEVDKLLKNYHAMNAREYALVQKTCAQNRCGPLSPRIFGETIPTLENEVQEKK